LILLEQLFTIVPFSIENYGKGSIVAKKGLK